MTATSREDANALARLTAELAEKERAFEELRRTREEAEARARAERPREYQESRASPRACGKGAAERRAALRRNASASPR